MRSILFYLQLLVIISVSAVDIFYTLLTQKTILAAEQNPVAKWVMENHGVNKFISIKTATTCLVVLALQWSYYNTKEKNKKAMWIILAGITIFQLGLLAFILTPPQIWTDVLNLLGL